MRRWLDEPLVHFLATGALLFGVHAWLHRGESAGSDNSAGPVRVTRDGDFLPHTVVGASAATRARARGVARPGRGIPERGVARPRSTGIGPRPKRPDHTPPARAEGRIPGQRHVKPRGAGGRGLARRL